MGTLSQAVLKGLRDRETPEDQEAPQDEGNNNDNGKDEASDNQDEPEDKNQYKLQFHFTDDEDKPYQGTPYIAFLKDGTETNGQTDENGYTETFITESKENIQIRLLLI